MVSGDIAPGTLVEVSKVRKEVSSRVHYRGQCSLRGGSQGGRVLAKKRNDMNVKLEA